MNEAVEGHRCVIDRELEVEEASPEHRDLQNAQNQPKTTPSGGGTGLGEGVWVLPDEIKAKLKHIFESKDVDKNGLLDEKERVQMRDEMRRLLIEFGMKADTFGRLPKEDLSFEAFHDWFVREWETASKMQALADVDVMRAVAESLPRGGSPDLPLGALLDMDAGEIGRVCTEKLAAALKVALVEKKQQVAQQAERMKASRQEQGKSNNSKFASAKFGDIEDFHKGIAAKIGLPNAKLKEGMEAEHCRRADSNDEFKPGNYDTTTTPAAEWGVVTDESKGRLVTLGLRRVRSLRELMEDPLAILAKLKEVELIGLVLYTGPMYTKYNAVLREFPQAAVDALKGNTYTTTIYCIVSGIIKLSKVMRLPDNRMVYRGLGGLELPQKFLEEDKLRISGGVEHGILSTTTEREVAIQYAGDQMPTLFEINVGAIDRGACLGFLSQYPGEEEILFPPSSYLEVVGESRMEAGRDGRMVRIVSLKVNANMMSSTIEQIEGRRKEIFLSAGENAKHEIKSKLDELVASDRVMYYLVHHPWDRDNKVPMKLRDSIVQEVDKWLAGFKEREADWFNDEFQYSKAMRELSGLGRMAMDKFEYWLTGAGGGRGDFLIDMKMEQVARRAESEMIRRVDDLSCANVDTGKEAGELALELCRRRGSIVKSKDETNNLGEPPLVASAARGDLKNLKLLLLSGCEVNSISTDGVTALHMACMMGHLEYCRRLADAGADLSVRDVQGRTGLSLAVELGHGGVVQLMLDRGGRELGMMVWDDGTSCAHLAARRAGGEGLLRQLVQVCGKELLMFVEKDGRSCALVAARDGHLNVLRYLHEVCGKELLMLVKTNNKASCAIIAAQGGRLNVVQYLHEACGKELLMLVMEDGTSCAIVAAENGHLNVLRYLHEACGKELLMLVNKDGWSCTKIAARYGHLDVLRYLHEACGKELLMLVDKSGWSCAILAAHFGHLNVLRFLHEACGKELLMLVDNNKLSCAYAAAQEGHLDVLRYLHEACGKELLMLVDKDGTSCAYMAAQNGHLNVLRFLQEACGKELFMLLDKDGMSCAHAAAQEGHLDVVRFLHEACGKELLMLVDKDGMSCAKIAAQNGNSEVVKYLEEVGK